MVFNYKAQKPSGKTIAGRIRADSTAAAIAKLHARKLSDAVVMLPRPKEAFDMGVFFSNAFKTKIGVRTLAVFCRQFAAMNQAAIPPLRCLQVLAQQTEDKRMKKIVEAVSIDIEGGTGLSDAFRKHGKLLPNLFVNMIAGGELSGKMDEVMERLATTFEREHALQSKIKSAMTYPIIILCFALLAVAALLIFVVPTFVAIFAQAGEALPLPTRILLALSDVMIHHWWIILPVIFVVIPVAIRQTLATRSGRRVADRIFLRLPIMGRMIAKNVTARFARNLSTLLKSGIPLVHALDVVEEIVGNTVAAEDIARARASVRNGDNMSPVLASSKFFPPMAVSMITIGEESGELDNLLEKLAVFYEQEVEAIVASLSSTIEPVMILGVGVIIGFIAISIYMPLFSLSGAMQAGSGVPLP
jgi:type IV pilus assembly protein PilC